ncbi:MAG TPA: dihydroorotate dehydrogenase [Thermotogota bacterium]|nr:dihydroorotate dehydrogenase [Thermotogota bacterium]HQC37659.1 dihydroorotate dehydrogenase [Thermotogota bacterium]
MTYSMEADLGAIGNLKSPIIVVSGTYGSAKPYQELLNGQPIGAAVTKTITKAPKPGNPQPRILEGKGWIINSIGLENPGIEAFVEHFEEEYATASYPLILSISGESVQEFCYLAEKVEPLSTPIALELNLSCPNVDDEGLAFGLKRERITEVVTECRKISRFPLIAKFSPFQAIDASFAIAAYKAGVSAISLINTMPAMKLDIRRFRSALGFLSGGMSGPALKPIALKMVYEISRSVPIPVIGMGGISCGEDAIEFLMAGAKAIGIGTANLVDPTVHTAVYSDIRSFIEENRLCSIRDIPKLLRR